MSIYIYVYIYKFDFGGRGGEGGVGFTPLPSSQTPPYAASRFPKKLISVRGYTPPNIRSRTGRNFDGRGSPLMVSNSKTIDFFEKLLKREHLFIFDFLSIYGKNIKLSKYFENH